jgi:membrane-bound lytic murein transglycosylase D
MAIRFHISEPLLIIAALVGVAGCASAPPLASAQHGRTSVATPPATVVARPMIVPAVEVVAAAAAAADSPVVDSVDSSLAAQSGDLFERLRSGFQLEDVDQRAIDSETNWYANNPDYLGRTFTRAELYMHYIIEQLQQRKMPLELALLPVVESAFEPYAYSKARAAGLWQFIPGTGTNYKLKQNWWYDGRRDVVESTRAALDYLQDLHNRFNGDWLLAIASYNCGEGNVERAVNANIRAGKPTDFWHLKLPAETRAYVPKLLAMRRVVAAPADYGLEFSRIPDESPFVSVRTGGQIAMQVVADIAGITKEDLYELNPAFHRWATDPTGPYSLLVPVEAADGLEATLVNLTPEQRLRIEHYTVLANDTLASVASSHNTTAAVLRELNNLDSKDRLAAGASLSVPSTSIELPEKAARAAALFDRRLAGTGTRRGTRVNVHIVRRGDTLSSIARRMGTKPSTLARLNDMKVGDTLRAGQRLVVATAPAASSRSSSAAAGKIAEAADGKRVTYTVRRGDTLYSVARVLQVTVGELQNWNSLGRAGIIKPGQRLIAFISGRG